MNRWMSPTENKRRPRSFFFLKTSEESEWKVFKNEEEDFICASDEREKVEWVLKRCRLMKKSSKESRAFLINRIKKRNTLERGKKIIITVEKEASLGQFIKEWVLSSFGTQKMTISFHFRLATYHAILSLYSKRKKRKHFHLSNRISTFHHTLLISLWKFSEAYIYPVKPSLSV